MKALTGLSPQEFDPLVEVFEAALYESKANKPRQRKVGGGPKGVLRDSASKLFLSSFI